MQWGDVHAGNDHEGDDHGGDEGGGGSHSAVLTSEETHSRIRYRQTVYALSCAVVLLACYFLGMTNKRCAYLQRRQLVPRLARTVFMMLAGAIMLIAGAVVDYDDRLSLIGIELSIFVFCLFVEFMCKWFILRPREAKSGAAGDASERASEVGDGDTEDQFYFVNLSAADAGEAAEQCTRYQTSGRCEAANIRQSRYDARSSTLSQI